MNNEALIDVNDMNTNTGVILTSGNENGFLTSSSVGRTQLEIFKIREHAVELKQQTRESACFDLAACLKGVDSVLFYTPTNDPVHCPVANDTISIYPHHRVLIPTGWVFNLQPGSALYLYPRSGNALKKGLTLINAPGIVDSDYKEEVGIILHNTSSELIDVRHGDRIAQGNLMQAWSYNFKELSNKPEQTTERDGGFGSTGDK